MSSVRLAAVKWKNQLLSSVTANLCASNKTTNRSRNNSALLIQEVFNQLNLIRQLIICQGPKRPGEPLEPDSWLNFFV